MSPAGESRSWLRLDAASRELRRVLRPIEWVVLEDVALDAVSDGTALVAHTSARMVAEHLGLTPGAAARALARLRTDGLVAHAREAGPTGRFGLSAYLLGAVPGLAVIGSDVPASDAGPDTAAPRLAPPRAASPRVAGQHMAPPIVGALTPDTTEQLALLALPPTARPRP